MKEPLPNKVHEKLRHRLVNGTYPPGSRLDYKSLARELGVSTTPVREAVTKLASEGFVELVPRMGAVVRLLTRAVAQELYEVREALECYAATKAAERMSPRHLISLKKHHAAMVEALTGPGDNHDLPSERIKRFISCDMQFHQTILSGARNPSLARTLEESQTLLRIFIITCNGNDPLRLSLACEDHQQIIDALAAGDADGAHAAMSRHIRQSLQLTLDHLDTPQANEPSPHHADGD